MMFHPALFILQTFVIVILAVVHLAALQWYLYWYYPWLDLLTHFLGGLWVVLAAAWFIAYTGRRASGLHLFGVIAAVGVGWEFFEIFAGVPREANFVFDTSLDLVMDGAGAMLGFALSRYLLRDTIRSK